MSCNTVTYSQCSTVYCSVVRYYKIKERGEKEDLGWGFGEENGGRKDREREKKVKEGEEEYVRKKRGRRK